MGGLVRHQRVEATGVDLPLSPVQEERCKCQAALRMQEIFPRFCVSAHADAACFPSWQRLSGIIHGTRPISRGACATHVFLFNLLVFSSSATTRTLPAIFFPTRDKRITDVRGWNVAFPPPLPHPSSCAATRLRQPLHSPPLPRFCFPEACPSLVRYVGT